MTASTATDTINLAELSTLLRQTDPAAMLIRKRLLRRVLWHTTPRRAHGFGLFQRQQVVIGRETLLQIVDSDELDYGNPATLPEQVILLGRSNALIVGPQPRAATLLHYWRLLFRARVALTLQEKFASQHATAADMQSRIEQIGRAEFDEITAILIQENLLFETTDPVAAYVQFVAKYLELYLFAPQQLYIYFPALAGIDGVDNLVLQDVDADTLFRRSRLPGAPDPLIETPDEEPQPAPGTSAAPLAAAPVESKGEVGTNGQAGSWAKSAEQNGNVVGAALAHARRAGQGQAPDAAALGLAQEEIRKLAGRLQTVLGQPPACREEWFQALVPLLRPAACGFWPLEARLLYDLQTVCLNGERELTSVDLMRWVVSLGRQPVRKPIPGRQPVLMLQELRSAGKRLHSISLPTPDRQRLERVLSDATHHQEKKVRDHFRPLLLAALAAVGLEPANVPETVARDKVVEELLDRIVGHGRITMSDLRDAVSRNLFKLDDLGGPIEFLVGDKLLRLNTELAARLDTVYRPGEFYLRWMQSLSALLFGTPWGRLLTRYVLLPFGGAFIALKFCFFMYQEGQHLYAKYLEPPPSIEVEDVLPTPGQHGDHVAAHVVERNKTGEDVVYDVMEDDDGLIWVRWWHAADHKHAPGQLLWDPLTTPWSLAGLGLFLFLVLHVPPFRRLVWQWLKFVGQGFQCGLIEFPAWLLDRPAVRALWDSPPVRFARRFLFRPLVGAALVAAVAWLLRAAPLLIGIAACVFFLAALLLLATRVGRALDEILSNWLLEGAHNFGFQFVPSVLRAVVDFFKWLMAGFERLLYGVDEWFRFRGQDNALTLVFKSVFGLFWLAISYVLRFLVVLFIEPAINPVKHFPMVTVAGKFMLLLIPVLPPALTGMGMGERTAKLFTAVIVIGVPGVFGFLVWELKENWRLYRTNRPQTLEPMPVGHHGETVAHLLQPGFHSGTVPKAFARWRRAERKGRTVASFAAEHQLEHVEEAVRNFVERDLLHLLAQVDPTRAWPLATGRIRLSVTLIRVEIACAHHADTPLVLGLELKSNGLWACVRQPGWLTQLPEADQQVFQFALTGLYHFAGVTPLEEKPITWAEWVDFWERQRRDQLAAEATPAREGATVSS